MNIKHVPWSCSSKIIFSRCTFVTVGTIWIARSLQRNTIQIAKGLLDLFGCRCDLSDDLYNTNLGNSPTQTPTQKWIFEKRIPSREFQKMTTILVSLAIYSQSLAIFLTPFKIEIFEESGGGRKNLRGHFHVRYHSLLNTQLAIQSSVYQ